MKTILQKHMVNGMVLLLLVLPIVTISAQNYVEIARLFYSQSSLNSFDESGSDTRLKELGLDLTVPLVINESNAVVTGLIYERYNTRLFAFDPPRTFSAITLKMGLSKKHSDRWSGTYVLLPKLSSDFEEISKEDFQLGGIVLLKFTKHENLNYKFGAYYNSDLFGPFLVPLLGLYYLSPNKKFESNLTLPFLADANYKLHERFQVGTSFAAQIRSYHLTDIPVVQEDAYVVKSTIELFGYLKFNLSRGVSIQTRVGHTLGRNYRVYDQDDKLKFASALVTVGDNRQQLNTDFSDGFLFQGVLQYRFIQD